MIVERLANHLHLVIIPDATMPAPLAVLAFRAGPRFETPGTAGFGRWWAESVLHGTPPRPTRRVLLGAFEDADAEITYHADAEMVALVASGNGASRTAAQKLLRETVEQPLHRVAEPLRKRLVAEWSADHELANHVSHRLFGDHPLAHQAPAAQYAALRTASAADLPAYAAEWIHPENGVLVCYCPAGEAETVGQALREIWQDWNPRADREAPVLRPGESTAEEAGFADARPVLPPSDPSAPFFFPSLRKGPLLEQVASHAGLLTFHIYWLGDGQGSRAYLAQEILLEILAGEHYGRLTSLDEQPDRLVQLGYRVHPHTDISLFELFGRCPAESLRVILRDLYREIFRTKRQGLDEREFARARRRVAARHQARQENPRQRALDEARANLLGTRRELDGLTQLTAADVHAAAQAMIIEDRMAVFLEGKVPRIDQGDIIQLVNGTLT